MAIFSDKNPYPGINAHLNSQLQADGWESFHSVHITHLYEALESVLPTGYLTLPEKSLQISEVTPPETPHPTKADLLIVQRALGSAVVAEPTSAQILTLNLVDTLTEEEALTALTIYQVGEGQLPGRAVTRIELLSPANKSGGSHYPRYKQRRLETLQSGLRLIEIDYLHESRPIVQGIPAYNTGEKDSHPFFIAVSDPRPVFEQGYVRIYGFGVDDVIPQVVIPLAGADAFTFDFNEPYQRTFNVSRLYKQTLDYAREPLHSERYQVDDQHRIRARMASLAKDSEH